MTTLQKLPMEAIRRFMTMKNAYWTRESFRLFSTFFRRNLTNELKKQGAKLTAYSVGHFYVSGFYRTQDGQCAYFSIPDVRFFQINRLMYRTAKDEKDFTGGRNHYVTIAEGMGEAMVNQLYMEANNVKFLIV